MDETAAYTCPNCGESITISVDLSAGRQQEYVEDCAVCCRPNILRIEFNPQGHVTVAAIPE